MGWVTCYNASNWKNGKVDRRAECDKLLTWDSRDKDGNITHSNRVLKSAMVGSTYYAAVETIRPVRGREVWAAVFLTCGRSKDGTIWGYKNMDETMEPYFYACPVSILNLLTPTDNDRANEWRRICRETAVKRNAERKEAIVLPGCMSEVPHRRKCYTSVVQRRATGFSGVRYGRTYTRNQAVEAFVRKYCPMFRFAAAAKAAETV